MKTTIIVNGKPVEIELTADQVETITKAPVKITDRVKTFDDVLAELKITPTKFKNSCAYLSADEIAYRRIKMIAQVLNEGWEAEPLNEDQYKYYPYFEVNGTGFSCDYFNAWISATCVGSRLCFKSSELAIYAGKQFIDIYNNLLK